MSKDNESFVFKAFRNKYLSFPDGEIIHQDKPDYIVKSKNKKIGIEITEAIIDPVELERYQLEILITDQVLEKLKDKLPFTFYISIHINKDTDLTLKKRRKAIQALVELCFEDAYNLTNFQYYRVHDFGAPIDTFPKEIQEQILASGYRNLPEGIKEVSIGRHDSISKSWNSQSAAMMVPHFTSERLKKILKEKEKKLENYMTCDEHWLLIWGSSMPRSYYYNVEINEPINTKVDKVFFIRPQTDLTEIMVNTQTHGG